MELKSFLICFFVLIIFPSLSYAMVISVQVQDVLNGRSSHLEFNKTPFVEIGLEWENIGSLDCNTRLEAEVTDTEGKLRRIWSSNVALAPGDSAFLQAYYLPEKSGRYDINIILHYCDRIIPIKNFGFEYTRPDFEALNITVTPKSTQDKVEFRIMPESDLKYVQIIPINAPKTWIFEPASAENISAGKEITVLMDYEPVVWIRRNATFAIVSENGYKEVAVELKESDNFDGKTALLVLAIIALILINIFLLGKLSAAKAKAKANSARDEIRTKKILKKPKKRKVRGRK